MNRNVTFFYSMTPPYVRDKTHAFEFITIQGLKFLKQFNTFYIIYQLLWNMVEEQKVRIDQSMSKIIDDVDKSHLRQLQVIKPLIIFFFF